MWYLYLDESGDLGFDFVNKKGSKFFTLTILALSSVSANRELNRAIKKTLSRKLNPRNKRKRIVQELKGSSTTIEVKEYFYQQVKGIRFGLYTITLNKKRVYEQLTRQKERVYNFIARKVLDQIPFEKAGDTRIELIVDRCKSRPEIKEFNTYVRKQLEARIDPNTPLDIYHWNSQETAGLQACDLFCWGVFQKYERKKEEWYGLFKEKILFEDIYLPVA